MTGLLESEMTLLALRVAQAESRCRDLLDHANDAVALIDFNGYLIQANVAWGRIAKLEPHRLKGVRITELTLPQEASRHLASFHALIRAGGGRSKSIAIRAVDGTTRWLEFSNSVVEHEGDAAVLSIGRDVTEHVLAMKALEASELRYRQLVERLPDVVWAADQLGNVSFVSSNVARVCGFTPGEIMAAGHDWWVARVHPDDRPRVLEAWRELFSAAEPIYDIEYRWQHRGGRYVWLHSRASSRLETNGVVTTEGLFSDVTERHVLERQLHQAQKFEAVRLLAGGVAHDFNNVLTVILANSRFLHSDLGKQDPRTELTTEIEEAAQRAVALNRQLLAFSQRQVVRPTVFAPAEVVQHLSKTLGRLLGEDIRLSTRLEPDAGQVRLDRGELEQIIMNLVVNARDAMPNGGNLELRLSDVRLDQTTRFDVGELGPGRYVELTVDDTGSGMTREVQRRLFEPFFTTRADGRGTGLGLATVSTIVRQANGAIRVTTAPGRGTKVTVLLPRVEPEVAGEAAAPAPRGGETVLLVEDDEMVAAVCRRILEAAGYRVVPASDVNMALELLVRTPHVDVVLTDVVMTSGTGPQLAEAISKLQPELEVVFMTGYSEHAALQSTGSARARELLVKPFSAEQLLTRLREALDRAAAAPRTP